ncbi:MAG: hypothetical protein ORO03_09660 [Alphaproteobacteria bacterium]|nr:hypothetical protein [Alphaproteobacteria bacterium]
MKLFSLIKRLKEDKIFFNSMIVSGFMIFGQLLSVYRERVLASYIGIGAQLDIYNTAFRIPDIIMAILMSLVATSTIIPFMSQEYYSDNNKYNSKFNSSLILFLSLILIIIIITAIFMPFVLKLLVKDNIVGQDFTQLVLLSRLLLLQPLLLGLSILFSSLGQIRDRFILSSLSPIIYNAGIIFGVIVLYNKYNLVGVIIGVLIGALGHLLLQLLHLRYNPINIHIRHFKREFI